MLCSVGNTLWLDPFVQREYLPSVERWCNNLDVRALLLDQEYAVENPLVCCCFMQFVDTVPTVLKFSLYMTLSAFKLAIVINKQIITMSEM